ncbi:MAG: thiamine pyrophosphate-binding protein [Peptococcaceae bacterium]|nr:thiamine pyrophosphate-binding protein [Peptococcaceae bacterium]
MRVHGNVADFILAQLAEWGVERIYGVLGDAIFPLMDAFNRQSKIEFISTTNEAAAAFMASYEARLTGRLTVCTATSGPGTVNLLNGLADAYLDGSPVLAITGQVETKKIGTRAKQYIDQQLLYRNFSRYTTLLINPAATAEIFAFAARQAYIDFSVAHVTVPKDVMAAPLSAGTIATDMVEIRKPQVFSGSNEKILGIIRNAQKPLVVVGQVGEDTVFQTLSLVHHIGSGLVVAQQAKGVVRGSFDRNLGGIGEAGLPPIVMEADCIILIGNASYEKKYFPKNAKLIHLAERPSDINVNAQGAASGDLGLLIEAIMHDLGDYAVNQDWVEQVKGEALRIKQSIGQAGEDNSRPVLPLRIMAGLNAVVPPNAIIVLDTGEFTHWFDLGFRAENQDVLLSSMWRSIGYGLPAAIGAQLANRERKVVAIIGDGGAISSLNELLTCARYNLAITIIIVKNQIYSIEKNKMAAEGLQPFGYELTTPDFVQFAKSCGVEACRIEDPTEIEERIGQAIGLDQPVLLEVDCASVNLPSL